MKKRTIIGLIVLSVAVLSRLILFLCRENCSPITPTTSPQDSVIALLYGIPENDFDVSSAEVPAGATLSDLLETYQISAATVDRLVQAAQGKFDLRKIRSGNRYTVFLSPDTLQQLVHFVYEIDPTSYAVFTFTGNEVGVKVDEKPVVRRMRLDSARIESSLWNAMADAHIPTPLAMELSEIFAWTIDFFALQKGDSFALLYEERCVDSVSVGTGRIWGAWFEHGGKRHYAIPFRQGERLQYWDSEGNSLRKNLLKAPLKYSRISSKFTGSRLHPILRIRRPHYGVDYAAPIGTPVFAVADGTVIACGYVRGGGNSLKIKHGQNLMSGYMHLRNFARGIRTGHRVVQGEVIGFVGSTGLSTGAHLDFRIWHNGKPVDPLKIPTTPAEPINATRRTAFDYTRQTIIDMLHHKTPTAILPDELLDGERPNIPQYFDSLNHAITNQNNPR